jgi:hypothetical protein
VVRRKPFILQTKVDSTNMADKDYDSDEAEEVTEKVEKETPEEAPEDATLNNPDVVTKYQEAAKIAQAALLEVVARVC